MFKRIIISTALVTAVFIGSASVAQDAPPTAQPPQTDQQPAPNVPAPPASVKASDTVYDTAGNKVGTIESVDGANAVLSTGTVKVQIPVSVIAAGAKGPTISVTKAEIEAQAKKSASQP